jgi:hypothetical protein
MGWERKRGKIEEFNRLLRGDTRTSYTVRIGDPSVLPRIRYCITLDSDITPAADTRRRNSSESPSIRSTMRGSTPRSAA